MSKFGGPALKGIALIFRFIEFCCAAIILGFFSYFLATLVDRSLPVATYIRAVEGISGVAVLYTLAGLILVCCLGGIAILSFIAILLDFAFTGAFIYVAWALRGGASSCTGNVSTPFGNGNTDTANEVSRGDGGITILPSFKTACRFQTACFAVAIIAAVCFPISMLLELALIKHHKKEKAFGPSPNNGYTAGSPRRKFWQRKPKHTTHTTTTAAPVAAKKGFFSRKRKNDTYQNDSLPMHTTPADMRTSYAGTDSTAVGHDGQPQVYNKYATAPHAQNGTF